MRLGARFALLGAAWVAVALGAPLLGASGIDIVRAFDGSIDPAQNTDAIILFELRLPRSLFALAAGAVLAQAGALVQTTLRNDLAEPYTLGVSSGSALGALLVIQAGVLATGAIGLGALVGAAVATLIVLGLFRTLPTRESAATMVLAGVALNVLFGGAIGVVQYLADPFQTFAMIRWLMGGVDAVTMRGAAGAAALAAALLAATVLLAPSLQALAVGDASARALGVAADRVRWTAVGLSAAATAAIVALSGPIGFVGLVVPHVARRLFGEGHRARAVAGALLGGAFLCAADAIARVAGRGVELPVGIVTSLVGGPAFLWVLWRRAR